jgi:hypothetical protein
MPQRPPRPLTRTRRRAALSGRHGRHASLDRGPPLRVFRPSCSATRTTGTTGSIGPETKCPRSARHARWFRHLSPRVPDSMAISGYLRVSTHADRNSPAREAPAKATLFARVIAAELVDRTQEVGGSSPPSSIVRKPRRGRVFALRAGVPGEPRRRGAWRLSPKPSPQASGMVDGAPPSSLFDYLGRRQPPEGMSRRRGSDGHAKCPGGAS